MVVYRIQREADVFVDPAALRSVLVRPSDHRTLQYIGLLLHSRLCLQRTAPAFQIPDFIPLVLGEGNDGYAAMVAVRVGLSGIQTAGDLRGVAMPSGILRALRCESHIKGLRRRGDDADAALVAGGVAAALVKRPAGFRLVKAALRVVREHGVGALAAHTVGFHLRLK